MSLQRKRLTALFTAAVLSVALLVPAAASADWGAIAVNLKTGKTGISYSYNTANGAKSRARNQCGKGCQVAVYVRNGYAALVQKPAPSFAYAAGFGRTQHIALRMARHRAHNQGAHTVATVFSGY